MRSVANSPMPASPAYSSNGSSRGVGHRQPGELIAFQTSPRPGAGPRSLVVEPAGTAGNTRSIAMPKWRTGSGCLRTPLPTRCDRQRTASYPVPGGVLSAFQRNSRNFAVQVG